MSCCNKKSAWSSKVCDMTCGGVGFCRSTIPQWIFTADKWMREQQAWVRRRGRQQHKRGRWERTCAGVQCTVRRKMKHSAWMNDVFWGRNSNLNLEPLEPRNTCRLYCAMTVHVKMWRAASVSVCTSPRRVPGNSNFRQAKKKASLNANKNTAVQSRIRIAKNSNFCSTSVVLFPLT